MNTDIWLFILGLMCAMIGFMAVWILNSINRDIKELKGALMVIPGLDRRITAVEIHLETCGYHRRHSNGDSVTA